MSKYINPFTDYGFKKLFEEEDSTNYKMNIQKVAKGCISLYY